MKKDKISYIKLIHYICNSIISNSNCTIIDTITQLSINYRLSIMKYLFVIIVIKILKDDFNKPPLVNSKIDNKVDDLELF